MKKITHIHSHYVDEKYFYVTAYFDENENSFGTDLAKVNRKKFDVTYLDETYKDNKIVTDFVKKLIFDEKDKAEKIRLRLAIRNR